jgi:hypothetical protein
MATEEFQGFLGSCSYLEDPFFDAPQAQMLPSQSSRNVFGGGKDSNHDGPSQPGGSHFFYGHAFESSAEDLGKPEQLSWDSCIDPRLSQLGDPRGPTGTPVPTKWGIAEFGMHSKAIARSNFFANIH